MKEIVILFILSLTVASGAQAGEKMKALIVDGQNNHHVWPKSTIMMRQYLEDTGLFEVEVARTQFTWRAQREAEFLPLAGVGETEDLEEPKHDPNFLPDFSGYDLVVSNFGASTAPWPEKTQRALERFMEEGGGFVSVHAADNTFAKWDAFNRMIGLGGWGGRNEKSGPYVYYTNEGELVRDHSEGRGGKHGAQHSIPITVRVKDHPITRGLPEGWLTARDECYALLRGPAENMTILATGKDMSDRAPTDRHEPMLMVIEYGKGRTFHTTLGHDDYSMEGVDFITTFTRGAEWAATGEVTQKVPADFPKMGEQRSRPFKLKK